MVATSDYFLLARVKESEGNTEEAIRYLKIYSKRIDRVDSQKQVNEKVELLRKQQFNRESNTKLKLKDN